MSDANRTRVAIVEETTFNETPANPAFKQLRITGSSLAYTPRTVTSNELRDDRQITDNIRVGFETGGQLPMEGSFDAQAELLEGVLASDWNARYNTGGAIADVTAAGIYTHASGVFEIGDRIRASGFTNPANNGLFTVTAVGVGTVTLDGAHADETPTATARIKLVGITANTIAALGTYAGGNAQLDGIPAALGLVAGDWLKVYGFAGDTNNSWVRVSAVDVDLVSLDIVPSTWAAIAAGDDVEVYVGDFVRNGVATKSYSIEQSFLGLDAPEYHVYRGMRVGALAFQADAQSILGVSATFMGAAADAPATARLAGATDVDAPIFDVMNTSDVAGKLLIDGQELPGENYVMATQISLESNLRRQNAFATPGSKGIGTGRANIRGRVNTYYGSKTLFEKLINNTGASYHVVFANGDGSVNEGLLFDVPRIKFAGGAPNVPGVDQDVMLDMEFQGLRHATLGYTVHVQRFEGFR